MLILTEKKLITCILPHGLALDVVQKLKDEKGIIEANVNNARGRGKPTLQAHRGVGEQTEKEILTVVVPSDQADELFEYIFDMANINRPHGGLIYMCRLKQASSFVLPDVHGEERGSK